MSVIGIDLGSQSCRVAVARQGGIETVDNEYSERSTCSAVSFGVKQRFLGAAAKNQIVTNAKNTVVLFKHLLGRKYSDPYVLELKKSISCELVELAGDEIGIRVNYLGEEETFTPVQVTAMLLSKIKSTTATAIKGKVTDVVLSVPSYFSDAQRRALLDATAIAGFNCLRLMNDTTASALAYGIYKQDLPADGEPPRYVVFVDLGHTSLQVALVAFNKGKLEVKAKAFNPLLGGRNFDLKLIEHFAQVFKEKYKIDSLTNVRRKLRLAAECEKLKKLMSANVTSIPINIECFADDRDVSGRTQRSDFEAMCADILEGVKAPLLSVLEQAGLSKENVYSVEIVGGSTRIPIIKDIITEVYGKPVSTTLNQDEAVARGCALQCAILSPTFRVRDFNLVDIQPFPIKLNWVREENEETGEMVLFKAGSNINSSKVLTMYRRSPFKISALYPNPSAIPTGQSAIGDFTVKGVVPTVDGEASKIKVKARLNIHGIFSIITATLYEKIEEPPPVKQPEASQQGQPMNEDQAKSKEESEEPPKQTDTNSTDSPPQTDGPQSPEDVTSKEEGQPESRDQQNGSEQPQEPNSQPSEVEDSQQSQQKMETESSATKEEKVEPPKKKQVKSVSLVVDSATTALSQCGLDDVTEKEGNMQAQDRKEADKAEAKNSLEEYVYDTREKLETTLKEFVTEQDNETLRKLLMDTEDWLYGDGEDETKSVYQDKLTQLKKLGNPIQERCREFEGRPAAMSQLAQLIVHYEKIVTLYNEGDERYSHLEAEEMKKVEESVKKRREWMDEKSQSQSQLPKYVDPVVKISQIATEQQLLDAVCKPIVTKPKPKAPPPKAEEPSATTEEGKGDKTPQEQPEQPEGTEKSKETVQTEQSEQSGQMDQEVPKETSLNDTQEDMDVD